ncbi:glycosyltransferase family 4 protein [Pantoea sp. Ap-967]|uniref:glycosyltransferase n=1 Tax=Pantoea sp. Ap-967 TaxID=2608362 RepID=UPI00141F7304|nr:glycosyltransferase [Pantoea sp. Ap-967]NIE73916.1 glycosyltransferase family 4 protein [Pantoea sp. Ap-967]
MTKLTNSATPTTPYTFSLLETLHSLRPDLDKNLISRLVIDETAYYRDHKDVHKAGVPAARHYFQYGEKEKRRYHYPRLPFSKNSCSAPITQGTTVFYTDAPEDNASWLYRCIFPHKKDDNFDQVIFFAGNNLLSDILKAVFSAKKMIFMRPAYSPKIIYLVQLCRTIGISVEFDYDDLLLPEYARERGACRSGLRTPQEDFGESLKQSALTVYADSFTCSTEAIALELRKINPSVTVRQNKLPIKYFKTTQQVVARAKTHKFLDNKVKILYLSGSNTHKRDFSTITGPLTKLAQQHPEKFSISFMGSLSDYSNVFSTLGVKSQMISTASFEKMLEIIFNHDLVLVPLENSVFNNCKSNIKYLECASQSVPVIASNVSEFNSVITDGDNGWLCNNELEWYEKLVKITSNPDLIISCGINAYKQAKQGLSV